MHAEGRRLAGEASFVGINYVGKFVEIFTGQPIEKPLPSYRATSRVSQTPLLIGDTLDPHAARYRRFDSSPMDFQ